MANIHVDSELMLHMMPAQPITTARRFTAVHDESHNPLLFSISSDGHFLAIKSDGCGRNVIIDLSNILNIRDTAHAFAVSQSTDNSGMIFVAFATENGPYTSNLHVFSPLRPNDLDLPGTELRKKLLISSGQTQKARITQLHMVSPDAPALEHPELKRSAESFHKRIIPLTRFSLYRSEWRRQYLSRCSCGDELEMDNRSAHP